MFSDMVDVDDARDVPGGGALAAFRWVQVVVVVVLQ
jgi:hypothetical protein